MNRRGFLGLLGMTVGGIVLDQAIPFNRVWSFPKEIKIAKPFPIPSYEIAAILEWQANTPFIDKLTRLPRRSGRRLQLLNDPPSLCPVSLSTS